MQKMHIVHQQRKRMKIDTRLECRMNRYIKCVGNGMCEHCIVFKEMGWVLVEKRGKPTPKQVFIIDWNRRDCIEQQLMIIEKAKKEIARLESIESKKDYIERENTSESKN